jgi:hypothetical protein
MLLTRTGIDPGDRVATQYRSTFQADRNRALTVMAYVSSHRKDALARPVAWYQKPCRAEQSLAEDLVYHDGGTATLNVVRRAVRTVAIGPLS